MEYILKKCKSCGALVQVLEDCTCDDCGIKCCGENMVVLKPNSVDAAFEKHLPTYEVSEDKITVTVNHVMEDDHYIEWIAMVMPDDTITTKYLKIGAPAQATFEYQNGSILYSYCNKHGLWQIEVK